MLLFKTQCYEISVSRLFLAFMGFIAFPYKIKSSSQIYKHPFHQLWWYFANNTTNVFWAKT